MLGFKAFTLGKVDYFSNLKKKSLTQPLQANREKKQGHCF